MPPSLTLLVLGLTLFQGDDSTWSHGGIIRGSLDKPVLALVITGDYSTAGDSLALAVRLMDGTGGQQAGLFEFPRARSDMPDPGIEELSSRLAGGLLLAFSD